MNMDLSKYEKTIGYSSISESHIGSTIQNVNEYINNSPNLATVIVQSVEVECVINNSKKFGEKNILFRPQTKIDVGDYIGYNEETYLTMNTVPSEIYPKAEVKICNKSLKWNLNSILVEYPCVVSGEVYKEDTTTEDSLVITHDADLVVYVQYNSQTTQIKPKQRFVFNGYAFEVDGIDSVSKVFSEKGLIKLELNSVSISDSDNTTDEIADDSSNSGWGGW
jgi:hypothetical protein